jgi:hypothetical protein
MIRSSRRRGHFDPRYGPFTGVSHDALDAALPAEVGRSNGEVQPIAAWENEGGRSSAAAEPDGAPGLVDGDDLSVWLAFSTSFPSRRPHDLVAIEAYGRSRRRRAESAASLRLRRS